MTPTAFSLRDVWPERRAGLSIFRLYLQHSRGFIVDVACGKHAMASGSPGAERTAIGAKPAPGDRDGKKDQMHDPRNRRDLVDPDSQLESDLREACAANGFGIAYQPQIDLFTRRVTTFEALVRWRHPVRGDVPPAKFIAVAEKIGLIDPIGQWVLERACRDAASWPADIRVAVNMSAIQLDDASLPAVVAAALEKSGLPPSRLELEVTETAVIPTAPAALATLHAIRNTGVRIVIDDFDVGYSALGYLLMFPFDKIKIDRSFVTNLKETKWRHEVAIAIVRAIVGLCKEINITCLAEGVETEEQLAVLIAARCPEIQGYLAGRPKPAADVQATIDGIAEVLSRMNVEEINASAAAHGSPPENTTFFQIVENANDIVIVTTPNLSPPGPTIIYVNPAFTRLTGYSETEAIGRTPRILQGAGTDRGIRDKILEDLRAGRSVHEKILNYAKSGAPYWLDLHIVPLRDATGAIAHFAAIERDVTLDKRRLDELEHFADRDMLTGIPNRRAFLTAMESECDAADARGATTFGVKGPCLAFIDVDHFKQVNDAFGHATGDAVLCCIADRLAENIRRTDVLGRIGGEEFAVCMPGVALADARALAERLRCAVETAEIPTPKGPVKATVSIGVACYLRGETAAVLTDRADMAMYAAKRAGRNRVRARLSKSSDPGLRRVPVEVG
jgi:diguanylate cyclase (GGDEF)-like protein/PAS domain S-box-containing protein